MHSGIVEVQKGTQLCSPSFWTRLATSESLKLTFELQKTKGNVA
jgi:hypothetical protein